MYLKLLFHYDGIEKLSSATGSVTGLVITESTWLAKTLSQSAIGISPSISDLVQLPLAFFAKFTVPSGSVASAVVLKVDL